MTECERERTRARDRAREREREQERERESDSEREREREREREGEDRRSRRYQLHTQSASTGRVLVACLHCLHSPAALYYHDPQQIECDEAGRKLLFALCLFALCLFDSNTRDVTHSCVT